jgi:hypothetical protein
VPLEAKNPTQAADNGPQQIDERIDRFAGDIVSMVTSKREIVWDLGA